jgi:hypothetical protein
VSETAKRIKDMDQIDDTTICYWYAPPYVGTADGKQYPGEWLFYIPRCGVGRLTNHTVVEHEDGTITVSPSILFTGHDEGRKIQRHGFIERGVWRDA